MSSTLLSSLGSIGAGLSGVSGVANSALGIANYFYQKNMQQEAWNREDKAVQRRAIDLEKAGLSKTLAAGSSASSSSPIAISAPRIDTGVSEALQNIQMDKAFAKLDGEIALLQSQKKAVDIENQQKELDYKKLRNQGLMKNTPTGIAGNVAQGLSLAGQYLPKISNFLNGSSKNTNSNTVFSLFKPNISSVKSEQGNSGKVGKGYGGGGGGSWGTTPSGVSASHFYGETVRPKNYYEKMRQYSNERMQEYYDNQGKNGSFGNRYR